MTVPDQRRQSVPVYCNQCVCGPDLFKVEVEDGIARSIEPNFDVAGEHPAEGRVCVRAYGLIQKTYNPHRITDGKALEIRNDYILYFFSLAYNSLYSASGR